MKKYFLIIFILIFNFNFIIAESNYSTTDNYTWLSEGYKFSLEIKDDEGNFTKIIDSKKAYMMKEGRLDNSLATAFSESLPSSGTFTGIRFTLQEWFIKAKGTIAGKVWYTNNVTDDNFTYQRFATDNISNYGEWTLSFAQMDAFNSTGGIQQESTLPSSLTMDGTNLILTAYGISRCQLKTYRKIQ